MPKKLAFIIAIAIVLTTGQASARPKKGFHTGPYLALEIGTLQADCDHNEITGQDEGRMFEPAFGFLFGWNIEDYFSTELQGRYATNFNSNRREQFASASLFAKWTLIADKLTDYKTLRILPFVKGGLSSRINALPGPTDGTVTNFALGPSFGVGVAFLFYKYVYFGLDIQEDLLFFSTGTQTINGVPDTTVYRGGFKPSFGALAILGVHY